MTGDRDPLATLGQRVLDAVIATYNPTHDPSLALAIHPGQALADGLVQNGVTNPLRLAEWLEDQYDYPLWLKRSDASSVSASTAGSLPAKSAYLAMIPWAQPSAPPDSPAYARVLALIADARNDLGDNPGALPFNCEPTDFAEVDSTGWHVFDERISSSTTTTTTTGVPPMSCRPNPQLWKMRAVTDEVVARLSSVADAVEQRKALTAELSSVPREEAVKNLRAMPRAMDQVARPVNDLSQVRAQEFAARRVVVPPAAMASRTRALTTPVTPVRQANSVNVAALAMHLPRADRVRAEQARAIEDRAPEPTMAAAGLRRELDPAVLARLATIQTHDLEGTPAVTEVTTSDSELHVHFEYCMLTITRRIAGTRWWHPELVAENDWYVPGMKRGDMVKPSTDDAYAYCLPQALLLVRNVEFSGSWTAEARRTMENAASFLGPFLMRATTATEAGAASVKQVSVLGVGIQVIGELCVPLPPLPPMDDPAGPSM